MMNWWRPPMLDLQAFLKGKKIYLCDFRGIPRRILLSVCEENLKLHMHHVLKVHLEAERKVLQLQGEHTAMEIFPFYEKITYRNGNKMICCLDGARIGIQYEISLGGEPCGLFHCVLESKSFLEKMTLHEHTGPFFLPVREAEIDYLSTNATKFIDRVGDLLQAYVDRRKQVEDI